MKDQESELQRKQLQIRQRRATLREGISEAAMDEIKKYFNYHLPVFLLRDESGQPITDNPHMLALLSARRDGMLHVIKWLEQERKQTPTTQYDNN